MDHYSSEDSSPGTASTGMPIKEKKTLKSINFILPENEFKIIKVYSACSGITIRDLISGVIRDWMEVNRETIEKTVKKMSGKQ